VRRVRLAPSILTADFARLGEEIASVAPLVDWFHLDVMDGHYVGNLTFGTSVVEAVRRSCETPLHVHLMISEPARYVESFVDAGAERVSFHPETVDDPGGVIDLIVERGAGAGLAVHPLVELVEVEPFLDRIAVVLVMTVLPGFGGQGFMHEVAPKIAAARALVDASGASPDVEVDGGVNLSTLEVVAAGGADVVVAGSAVYDGRDARAAAARLRRRLDLLAAEG
jgi:ribulose-phosphate 3-epimerase